MESCDFSEGNLHIRVRKIDISHPNDEHKKFAIKGGSDYDGVSNMYGHFVAISAKVLSFVAPNKFYEYLFQMLDLNLKDIPPEKQVKIGYVVENPINNEWIGTISLINYVGKNLEQYAEKKLLEIGLYIYPEYRRKGYVKTFYRRVIDFILDSNKEIVNDAIICFTPGSTNTAMKNVANMIGARYIKQEEETIDFTIMKRKFMVDLYFL
ncbi:MAG: hypothetical protein Satyrvirus4_7 [Satyrvirus sp.]|uniref:N-acetyltransferase domain-containing protein n=1 Tax=Satyrvirus sp. TaxID=2487771 RepID=A0A3G5AD59_9VIRU|nr:MAG: hypothetical protein Satyrvirus4_7 [Satyrvirus sp.]